MYMSYYKRPELIIFDEEECKEFGRKHLQHFWDYYQSFIPRYFKNGQKIEQTDKERALTMTRVAAQLNTEIANGVYARNVKNIYHISPTFSEAMHRSIEKLRPLTKERGIYRQIHENCVIMDGINTFVFMTTSDDNARLLLLAGETITIVTDYRLTDDGICDIESLTPLNLANPTVSGISNDEYARIADGRNEDLWRIQEIYNYLLFKKYGNINIETVAAKKTLKRSQILGEKVNNFMGIDVQVLDSRWFTTICRDEGFLVSGHFRLQNVKENGGWTKRLIYINPYAKHGYHRLAPIVNIEKE